MVLYASPAWWNGSASQAKTIEIVQNRGLRFITGAFRTTPISAMQIEASIPPINLTLDYINKRKANTIQHYNPRHPVTHRLLIQHQSNNVHATDGLLFKEPHKPISNRTRPENRAAREQKNAKCTPVFRIGQHMLTNTEKINKTAEAPWHRIDERVKIRVPLVIPGKPQKLKWATQHKRLLCKIETKPEELTVYTDGSLSHDQGVRQTGAGIVAFRRGESLFQRRIALGEFAEVYDAEMEGLASGAEAVLEWLAQTGPRHGIRQIWFFADNTGALQ